MGDSYRETMSAETRSFWSRYDDAIVRVLRILGVCGLGAYFFFGVIEGKDVHGAFLWICAFGILGKDAVAVSTAVAGKLK